MRSERNRTTGYYGVTRPYGGKKFRAQFRYKATTYVSFFDTAEDAASWVDSKLEELGITALIYARLNRQENDEGSISPKKRKERQNKLGNECLKYEKDRACWAARIRRDGKEYKVRAKTKEDALEKLAVLKAKYPTKSERSTPKPPKPKKERKPLKTKEELQTRQKQTGKEWYKKNAEEIRKKARENAAKRKKENPEHVKNVRRKYYEKNKDRYAAKDAARRAKTKNPPVWCPEANKVYAKMRREAKRLEKLTAIVFEVDHIVPLNGCTTAMYGYTPLTSGLHCSDNFQLLTKLDNNSKNAYTWPDMWDYNDTDLIELQRIYETNIKHITN